MAMLSTLLILAEKPNICINLSSESSRRSPPINIAERSPTPILLPNAAASLKQSSKSFDVIDIARLSLHESLALYQL
jgi:hypothetical protein